ncbi:MAG: hypothetical protein IJ777_01575 [Clostridia bacterium]|nr:hypothetical protein [Clostridia bacterium]
MDTSGMKNIVVLRNLPSNLVEEAIVVLKQNQKLKKVELVDIEKKNNREMVGKKQTKKLENSKDYIVKEAQLLVSEYITKIEGKNKKADKPFQKLQKKYKMLKFINIALVGALLITLVLR